MDEADRPLSVSELVTYLNRTLASGGPLKVIGEVSALKIHGGHRYFDIKDDRSLIHGMLFSGTANRVKAMPEDGQRFIFSGKAEVYGPNGKLSMIVSQVEFDDIGRLRAALEELRARLDSEGVFDPSRKRPLPFLPRKVGLITSPTGAVIHDLQETILHRYSNMDIALYPVNVQGATSAASVIAAINQANRENICDVLILARGGGSFEDMYAFNTEPVVRAILNSKIPIITALGHTSDRSLSDMVSDWECRTPTEAGNKVVPDKTALLSTLLQYSNRLSNRLHSQMLWHERNLMELDRRLSLRSSGRLMEEQQIALSRITTRRINAIDNQLRRAQSALNALNVPTRIATAQRRTLYSLFSRLQNVRLRLNTYSSENKIAHMEKDLAKKQLALDNASNRLLNKFEGMLLSIRVQSRLNSYFTQRFISADSEMRQRDLRLLALSPQATLNRGYSVVRDSSGKIIRRSSELKKSDLIKVHLSEGEFTSIIKEII